MNHATGRRVLVTGGAGFIGSHTVDVLLQRGWSVRVLDNLSSGNLDNLPRSHSNLQFVLGDVRNKAIVDRAVSGMSHVIHLAAQVAVEASFDAPAISAHINILGFLHVLEAAAAQSVRRVVYASSAAVYGEPVELPLREESVCRPESPYGLEKHVTERYAKVLHSSFANRLSCLGLRYFNVFGPRQDPASPYSGVISIFLNRIGCGLPITIYGDGSQTRDFVYVRDVAEVNARALDIAETGTLNVCSNRSVDLLVLADTISKLTGQPAVPLFRPTRPGDIRHSCGDDGRLMRVLRMGKRTSLKDGLCECIALATVRQNSIEN